MYFMYTVIHDVDLQPVLAAMNFCLPFIFTLIFDWHKNFTATCDSKSFEDDVEKV